MPVVCHCFIDKCIQFGIILFQRFPGRDSDGAHCWGTVLPVGIEISQHALGPILIRIVDRRAPRHWPSFISRLIKFPEPLIELRIQAIHPQFVLLDGSATVFPIWVHRPGTGHVIQALWRTSESLDWDRRRVCEGSPRTFSSPTTSSFVSGAIFERPCERIDGRWILQRLVLRQVGRYVLLGRARPASLCRP